MAEPLRPRLEILENRLTPTTYGVPWPDPQHLTISFVPDGTAIGNQTSDLDALLNSTFTQEANWETKILRAFQTWAAVTNINLSVVPDDGAPIGTTAPLEGGSGFGDIRIAAAPLGYDLLATTTPYDPESGSWSGAVIFNSNFTFGNTAAAAAGTAYDLYSVALHEAGHAFGLASNLDDTSVMFNYYNGILKGLAPQDKTAIQALYGTRSEDAWASVPGGNATPATATNFMTAVQQQDITNVTATGNVADAAVSYNTIDADMSSRNDVEYFQYEALGQTGGFTVNLQTSTESLLEAQVTVVDQNGNVVGSAVATNPQNGNLSVYVADAVFGEDYSIEVQSAKHGVFGVGAYQLQVVADDATSPALEAFDAALASLLETYAIPINTKAKAAVVQPMNREGTLATTTVTLTNNNQAEWLNIQAPNAANSGDGSLTVTVWTTSLDTALPTITLTDAKGDILPTTVVTEANGSIVITLADATPKAEYFLKLKATKGSGDGTFQVNFAFGDALPDPGTSVAGTLTVTNDQGYGYNYFNLSTAGVVQLQASASSTNSMAGYEVMVIDSSGNIWYDQVLTSTSSLQLSTTLVLPEGNYEVAITAATQDGSALGPVNYTFLVKQLNAPLGPPVTDPQNPPPLPSSALWLEVPPAYLYITNTDPYGRPFQYPIPGAPPVNQAPLG